MSVRPKPRVRFKFSMILISGIMEKTIVNQVNCDIQHQEARPESFCSRRKSVIPYAAKERQYRQLLVIVRESVG